MPYVNVRIKGTATKEEKAEIVKQMTRTLQEVLGKPPEATYIVIDEVSGENWAKGGNLLG